MPLSRRDLVSLPLRSLLRRGGSRPGPRRNVLFIAVDDLRPKLRYYGDAYAVTPHIDWLASGGIVFDRAYCQQAVCGPTRASLLTGLRPDTTRVYDLDTSFRKAAPNAVTLPEHFRLHGYHTECIGKIFHDNAINQDARSWSVPERFQIGQRKGDQYALAASRDASDPTKKGAATESASVPDEAYIDGRVAADAVTTLGRLKNQPFFLAVGFRKPHLPFTAPRRYWELYKRDEVPLARNPYLPRNAAHYAVPAYSELRSYADIPDQGPLPPDLMRHVIHGYYAATSFCDAQIGKVLAELGRLGLAENTVVALWGDHGWHLGEHTHWGKLTNFEICVRAPLILRVPGTRGGQRSRALVEFVDIFPTLAEACALDVTAGLEGCSMLPLLADPDRAWKKAAFSQFPREAKGGGGPVMGYSVRTDRYRYTEWQQNGRAVEAELYDHRDDPDETRNLAGEAELKRTVADLQQVLSGGWRKATPQR